MQSLVKSIGSSFAAIKSSTYSSSTQANQFNLFRANHTCQSGGDKNAFFSNELKKCVCGKGHHGSVCQNNENINGVKDLLANVKQEPALFKHDNKFNKKSSKDIDIDVEIVYNQTNQKDLIESRKKLADHGVCPENCNGVGLCLDDGTCRCNSGYYGGACSHYNPSLCTNFSQIYF